MTRDEQDRRIAELEDWSPGELALRITELETALAFVCDQSDEMINRLYGGELPCNAHEAEQWAKVRALVGRE